MEIEEIKQKRHELALKITELIKQFELETQVQITSVDLKRIQIIMHESKLQAVQLRAELDG